ncbi:twin-arginine translocase TatA/TatE family subunit [Nakamurella sp. YIM 132087]|uniref:Sec-independent protein translocase protein TatA n=1 Tax=Nakamurella alba TaxID=2665158 RepID=A0A7K1FQW8_9ACTN|nr:Sec-independent protein translocase subunit TatA [Nakamurella alba]MTD16538.1 twin-arginine translocase TatA/TatE family subunit [Nakamurella alba]
MGGLSWWHWLLIVAAFVLLFGAKKLPDAARGVGRSLRILKSEVSAMHDDDAARNGAATPPPTAAPAPPVAAPAQIATPAAQPVQPTTSVNGVPVDQQRAG